MPSAPKRKFSFRRIVVVTNVVLVLLAAFGVGLFSYVQLNRQAEAQALDLARLHGRMAAESLARIPDEILASARILRDRPTLARYLRRGNVTDLQPFLDQFRRGGKLDFVMVVVDGGVAGTAGQAFDEYAEERWPVVDAPFSTWWLDPAEAVPVLNAVALAPLPDDLAPIAGYVLTSRRVDRNVARERLAGLDEGRSAEFDVLVRRQLAEAPAGSLERAVLYAESALARVEEGRNAYAAAVPLARVNDRMAAVVVARLSRAEFQQALSRLINRWLSAVAGLVLLAVLIGIFTSRRLGRPVRSLTTAAARMSQDDFSTPVPILRDRDLGLLGDTMEGLRSRVLQLTDELRQREAEARLLLANIAEGVYAVDADRRITFMNPQAGKLLGVDADHALGRFCGDVLQPEPVRGRLPCHFDCPIVKARAGTDTRALEVLNCGAARHDVVIRSAPPAAGKQVQLIRDETRTEAGRRLRDSVIANVSHEFKTPLAAQMAALELLEDSDQPAVAETRSFIHSIRRATLRLNQLIDNLLESVRIDSNQDRLELGEADVGGLIDEAVELVDPLLRQKEQLLEIDLAPELDTIEADGKRLVQVLVNLLSNASKYSPEGSRIELSAEAVGPNLRIVLADQGPGLDEDGAESIFERFYRAPGLSAGQAGMGLGLWVARSIVERHGGWIEASSRPEGGSMFRVFIARHPDRRGPPTEKNRTQTESP